MQEIRNSQNSIHHADEIDLQELFKALWLNKNLIIFLTASISLVAVIYSLLLPNIYQSKAVLVSADSNNTISSALQGYSGLASLAGISISSGGGDLSNSEIAIEKLKSLSFFEQGILPNIFLPDLMARPSWDHNTNSLNYDEDLYDSVSMKWIRNYAYPQKQIPSSQESFQEFLLLLQITENTSNGFITLSIKHPSPYIAKEWTELMINQINFYFREKDKLESTKAVKYLNQQIAMTNLTEIKQAISQIIKEETQKLALIEAKQNYVFDYIDPPVVTEKKSEPERALISILGAILGAILSILFVLIKYYTFTKKLS